SVSMATPVGARTILAAYFLAFAGVHRSPVTTDALGGEVPARLDRYGDAIPEGAVARFGTKRFRPGSDIYGVAYSPDGRFIATAGQGVSIWEAATGKLVRRIPGYRVAMSNGKLLATANYDKVGLWEAETGAAVAYLDGHTSFIPALAFSPDGLQLAT